MVNTNRLRITAALYARKLRWQSQRLLALVGFGIVLLAGTALLAPVYPPLWELYTRIVPMEYAMAWPLVDPVADVVLIGVGAVVVWLSTVGR